MDANSHAHSGWYRSLSYTQLVVITGAGASVPLGMPAMTGFYELLDPANRSWALRILKSFKEAGNDLEFLLGRIAFYEQLRNEVARDAVLKERITEGNLGELVQQVVPLREKIFDTIIRFYGRLSPQAAQKAVELYKDLYLQLLEAAGNSPLVLPIFTTNYDLTFEAIRDSLSDRKLCNGLEPRGEYSVWAPEVYKKQFDYSFAVFRLHGCSHWFQDKSSGEIVFQPLPDRRDPENKEPRVLYPVPGKDERIDEDPFRTAYEHLRVCLAAAKTVVILGYSGRDLTVQRCLSDALIADPQKKFVVVTASSQLRPELAAVIPKQNIIAHIGGGIEGHTTEIWKAATGRLEIAVGDSLGN